MKIRIRKVIKESIEAFDDEQFETDASIFIQSGLDTESLISSIILLLDSHNIPYTYGEKKRFSIKLLKSFSLKKGDMPMWYLPLGIIANELENKGYRNEKGISFGARAFVKYPTFHFFDKWDSKELIIRGSRT